MSNPTIPEMLKWLEMTTTVGGPEEGTYYDDDDDDRMREAIRGILEAVREEPIRHVAVGQENQQVYVWGYTLSQIRALIDQQGVQS
jgi:hypothetical protein